MYEEYIEELEDKVEELEDKNLNNKAWKDFYADENIKLRKENTQLQNNWNELKKWLEETIKQYDNVGLKFKKASNFECASRSYDYLKQYQTMLNKMQELEQGKDE